MAYDEVEVLTSHYVRIMAVLAALICSGGDTSKAQVSSEQAPLRQSQPKARRSVDNAAGHIQLLHSQDPKVVADACFALGDLRAQQAVPEITSVLNQSGSLDVQAKCAFALGRIGSTQAVGLLRTVATDLKRNAGVRVAAIRATSMIVGGDSGYLPALLTDSDSSVRAASAYVLCELRSKEAIPGIKTMLASNDTATRQAALTAASVWPEAFSHELAELSARASNSPQEKITALTALSGTDTEKLSNQELQTVAGLLEKNPQPEIVSAVEQLLNESTAGKTIASERNLKRQPGVHQSPDEASPIDLPVSAIRYTGFEPVVSATVGNRRNVPVYLGIVLAFAAFFPLLIAAAQGLPRRALRPLSLKISAKESVSKIPPELQREGRPLSRMLLAAACLGLACIALWITPLLIGAGAVALPGEWASVLQTIGFGAAGAYVWTIAVVLSRASRDDLGSSLFWGGISGIAFSLFVSMLIVTAPIHSQRLENGLAFACGVLAPFTIGLAFDRLPALATWKGRFHDDVFLEPAGDLRYVSGLGPWQSFRLMEAKIENVQQLATADLSELIRGAPFPTATLMDWIDQAIALNHFSVAGARKLKRAGLKVSALELSLAAPEAKKSGESAWEAQKVLSDTISKALELPPELVGGRLNLLYHNPQLRRLVRLSHRTDKARWLQDDEGATA